MARSNIILLQSRKNCRESGSVAPGRFSPAENSLLDLAAAFILCIEALVLDHSQSSAGIITRQSSESVVQTVDRLKRLMAERGFTVFNVIDHSGVAERAGVQMPKSKLVMFGKPTVGAAVMLAAPPAALDIPLKVLVWKDRNGAVSVSYNSPEFLAERHHLEGAMRAPFDAVESIVAAALGGNSR